jgi:alpha-galactosidase
MSNLQTVTPFAGLGGPGCWPYPDMMQVGVTQSYRSGVPTLTVTESRTHFGAWCVVSSPLTLGFDLRDAQALDSVWDIITNR